MKEIAIYTALTGNYSNPAFIEGIEQILFSCDVFIFSNKQLSVPEGVQVVRYLPQFADPIRQARYFKVAGHPILSPYSCTIWVDANIKILASSAHKLWDQFAGTALMAVANHSERDCIYDEAEACLKLGKDDATAIYRQVFSYRFEGYPCHAGLQETGMVFRRNHAYCHAVSSLWWHEIEKFSRRDQLSLNYVFYKLGDSNCRKFDIDWYHNDKVLLTPHQFTNPGQFKPSPPVLPIVQGLPIPLPSQFPYPGLIPAIWQLLHLKHIKWFTFSTALASLYAEKINLIKSTGFFGKANEALLIDMADKLDVPLAQLMDKCKNGVVVVLNYAYPTNADALQKLLKGSSLAEFRVDIFEGILLLGTNHDSLVTLIDYAQGSIKSWELSGNITQALYHSHSQQTKFWQWLQPFYNHPLWKLKQKLSKWRR